MEEVLRREVPNIEDKRPALLFEILNYRFEALLEDGQLSDAVRLSREHMAPLSTAHPDLLPALRVKASSHAVRSALLTRTANFGPIQLVPSHSDAGDAEPMYDCEDPF